MEHDLTVGMAGRRDNAPAVHGVSRVEQVGVGLVADEGPVQRSLLDELGRLLVGNSVPVEPVDEHLAPVLAAPHERALLVVEPPLGNRRAGQLGEIAGGADMVGMEVGDDDPGDPPGQPVELVRPPFLRVGEPEPGVDECPAVVAGQQVRVDVPGPRRQRERDPPDASLQLVHAPTLRASPSGRVGSSVADLQYV
jgi:hypothetical protein